MSIRSHVLDPTRWEGWDRLVKHVEKIDGDAFPLVARAFAVDRHALGS